MRARAAGFRHRLLLAGPHPLDRPAGRTYPYSFRTESDPHRPWIMYYASLSIWAFVHAINGGPESKRPLNNLGIAEPVQRELMYQTGGGGGGGGFHQQSLPTGHGLSSPPPHLQHHQHTHLQPGTHVQPFGGLHDTLPVPLEDGMAAYHRVAAYLSRVAEVPELTDMAASSLSDGLPDLLDYLQKVFSEARSELMQEACVRLKKCRDILLGMAG